MNTHDIDTGLPHVAFCRVRDVDPHESHHRQLGVSGDTKMYTEDQVLAAIEADRKRFAELFMDLSRYADGMYEQDNDLLLAGVSDGYWYAAEYLLGNKGAVEELEADRQARGNKVCQECGGNGVGGAHEDDCKYGAPEPVAFSYELASVRLSDGEYTNWSPRLSYTMPNVPEGSIRNLKSLYTAPQQARGEPVSMTSDAAIAAIQFALETDEAVPFLHCWNEGDFDAIRKEWPECPEAAFIGADPQHPETRAMLEAAPKVKP